MKIGFVSLGCSKNLVDSEKIMGMLKEAGHEMVAHPDQAEVIFINTCGFIQPAKEEAINTILEMAEYKKYNCKKLIVLGCLAQRYKEELIKEMPEVDRFIAIREYPQLNQILEEELHTPAEAVWGLESPSILTTLLLTLFKSTPRFSRTLAATPSPSRIKPKSKCSVPI